MMAEGRGVLRKAKLELLDVGSFTVLLAKKELTQKWAKYCLGIITQGSIAGQVILDCRPLASLPAVALVL
jgi:hypothetical protein